VFSGVFGDGGEVSVGARCGTREWNTRWEVNAAIVENRENNAESRDLGRYNYSSVMN
jgi:hypothetical protein